jgi:hypothetical protein
MASRLKFSLVNIKECSNAKKGVSLIALKVQQIQCSMPKARYRFPAASRNTPMKKNSMAEHHAIALIKASH